MTKFFKSYGLWLISVIVSVTVLTWLLTAHSSKLNIDLITWMFGAKLAFLGLIIAGGTFQYTIYQEVKDNSQRVLIQPLNPPQLDWKRNLAAFTIKYTIPHNRVVIINYLLTAFCLLFSIFIDLSIILFCWEFKWMESLSISFFVYGLFLLLHNAFRYFSALHYEFGEVDTWYKQALENLNKQA